MRRRNQTRSFLSWLISPLVVKAAMENPWNEPDDLLPLDFSNQTTAPVLSLQGRTIKRTRYHNLSAYDWENQKTFPLLLA